MFEKLDKDEQLNFVKEAMNKPPTESELAEIAKSGTLQAGRESYFKLQDIVTQMCKAGRLDQDAIMKHLIDAYTIGMVDGHNISLQAFDNKLKELELRAKQAEWRQQR